MPAAWQELMDWVLGLCDGAIAPDTMPFWADGTMASVAELAEILALVRYEGRWRQDERRRQRSRPARRRAMALLRSFLSPAQQRQLRACRYFDVESPSGLRYRFWPQMARMALLEPHGKRWYEYCTFCIHPEDADHLPNPDVTLAQLLLLSADEEAFLEEAHPIPAEHYGLWDGEYRRRLREQAEEAVNERGDRPAGTAGPAHGLDGERPVPGDDRGRDPERVSV